MDPCWIDIRILLMKREKKKLLIYPKLNVNSRSFQLFSKKDEKFLIKDYINQMVNNLDLRELLDN